jgi:hypothetical protein
MQSGTKCTLITKKQGLNPFLVCRRWSGWEPQCAKLGLDALPEQWMHHQGQERHSWPIEKKEGTPAWTVQLDPLIRAGLTEQV